MMRLGLTLIGAALLAFSLSATAGERGHDRLRDSYHQGHHGGHGHQAPGWQRHRHGKHHHKAPRVSRHHHYYHRDPAYYPRAYYPHSYSPHRYPGPSRHRSGVNGHVTIHF